LQFNGDSVKLCNRCHETEFARTDIHPVGVPLMDAMNGCNETKHARGLPP
jgi:hypothetical protein